MNKQTAIRLGFLLCVICFGLMGQAQQPWLPRDPSPGANVSQTVGISTISVNYSRPAVKGRVIWGTLVPYGWDKNGSAIGLESPWRAGANENTILHLSDPATIEGVTVPAGNYGLFFVVNKDNTGELILSKDYKSWGSFFYDPKNDQMRAKITVRDMPASTERLTYSFDVIDHNTAELDLNWEKKQFPIKIAFAVDQIVMANATELLNGQTGFIWQNNTAAANYSLTNKIDLDQGIKWSDRAIQAQPAPSMGPYAAKAGILDLQGKHTESEKILNDAMAKASEIDLNAYGYTLINNKQYDKAIAAFKLNTERHPESPNTWDSLGEAYALSGDKQNAITNFKKSLSLNPPANVKANSEKYLKQLGAM
jgi:predicted negative regulator of RcsB-dependent stress response